MSQRSLIATEVRGISLSSVNQSLRQVKYFYTQRLPLSADLQTPVALCWRESGTTQCTGTGKQGRYFHFITQYFHSNIIFHSHILFVGKYNTNFYKTDFQPQHQTANLFFTILFHLLLPKMLPYYFYLSIVSTNRATEMSIYIHAFILSEVMQ